MFHYPLNHVKLVLDTCLILEQDPVEHAMHERGNVSTTKGEAPQSIFYSLFIVPCKISGLMSILG